MNERLDVIAAAMWGAALGSIYWLYRIITDEEPLFDSSEHLAGAAGEFISSLIVGAFLLGVSATPINMVSRVK